MRTAAIASTATPKARIVGASASDSGPEEKRLST